MLFSQKFMFFIFYFLSQGLATKPSLVFHLQQGTRDWTQDLEFAKRTSYDWHTASPRHNLMNAVTWFSKLQELLDYNCEKTLCKQKPAKPSSLGSANGREPGIHTGRRDGSLVKSCPSRVQSPAPRLGGRFTPPLTPAPGNLLSFLASMGTSTHMHLRIKYTIT